MPGNKSSPQSAVVDVTYRAMEEVNEHCRALGQEGEFRQLGKGRVASQWRLLHLGQYALTSHRLDKRICAHLTPPKGCVILAIMPPPYSMLVNGVEIGNEKALMMDANSEADFVTPGETECQTLFVAKSDFKASARALFPRIPTNGGSLRILECSASEWSALHGEATDLLRNGSLSPEDVSHLLDLFLGLMAGESEQSQGEPCLGNKSTARVARRARDYVEDHYGDTIRMEDLCRHTGVSLRTLQRSFSEYFQVSPIGYIKVRRLNAARQALVAGDSSRELVTQIAFDNGFTHLGRFSVDYREHFGELPRETLGR